MFVPLFRVRQMLLLDNSVRLRKSSQIISKLASGRSSDWAMQLIKSNFCCA